MRGFCGGVPSNKPKKVGIPHVKKEDAPRGAQRMFQTQAVGTLLKTRHCYGKKNSNHSSFRNPYLNSQGVDFWMSPSLTMEHIPRPRWGLAPMLPVRRRLRGAQPVHQRGLPRLGAWRSAHRNFDANGPKPARRNRSNLDPQLLPCFVFPLGTGFSIKYLTPSYLLFPRERQQLGVGIIARDLECASIRQTCGSACGSIPGTSESGPPWPELGATGHEKKKSIAPTELTLPKVMLRKHVHVNCRKGHPSCSGEE